MTGTRQVQQLLPLTSNQTGRLAWTEWLQAQGTARLPHHIGYAVRLVGPLDVGHLRRAVQEVVARHETLRAAFPLVDGTRVQAIGEPAGIEVDVERLADVSRVADLVYRPFDLSSAPLLRIGLLPLGRDEHVFVLGVEHLVADGLSVKVILEEVSALYGAMVGEAPRPSLPDEPSWTHHVRGERDWLRGPDFARQLDWWRRRLAGCCPVASADLPMLGPTAPTRGYFALSASAALDREATERLESLVASRRLTLFSALLGVLVAALVLRTGSRDIVVQSPNGNRWTPERERLVGWVSNMMAVRTGCDGDPSFAELARGIQRDVMNGLGSGRAPFDELVRHLWPEHYGRLSPTGCTFFSVAPAWRYRLDLPGIVATPFPIDADQWCLGISVDCAEADGGLAVQASADRGLYEQAQAEGLVRDFVAVARAVVRGPDAPISRLG